MPLHCLYPCEQDVVSPDISLPLIGHPGVMVAHGWSDEFVIIHQAKLIHLDSNSGGGPNPSLNQFAQLLDGTFAYRQDWAVLFLGVPGGLYSLELSINTWGSCPSIKTFPVLIPDLISEAVVTILLPPDGATVDDRHFVSYGRIQGAPVLNYVKLRKGGSELNLSMQYQTDLWIARWVNIPATHQNTPVILAAKPPGAMEVTRNVVITRLQARNA
jgi:hypothetical protein